jgi:hypothetical protein
MIYSDIATKNAYKINTPGKEREIREQKEVKSNTHQGNTLDS